MQTRSPEIHDEAHRRPTGGRRPSLQAAGASARRPAHRGSVLILVVGVLVLLAISATVYVSVGRMESLQASAQESFVVRDEAASKVVAHIGDLLALDLFGNDPSAAKPFEDGERWDYPFTAPGADFDVQADPWLASAEPVAPQDQSGSNRERAEWTTWPHFSNIHPNGRFVALDRLFSGDGIYDPNLFINDDPRSLDTRDIWGGEAQRELRFDIQLDEIELTSDGYVTMADRSLGTDTDGDGRIDARWTELPELYGLPDGMRMFVAARIVDLASAINVNTSVELGLTQSGAATAGTGRYPSDVDLYTMLFSEYVNIHSYRGLPINRSTLEDEFVEFGFREYLKGLGFFEASYSSSSYLPQQRLPIDRRDASYVAFGREGTGAFADRVRFATSDELDLRPFWGTSNDRATSLLELRFTGLNGGDPEDPVNWLNPLRDLFPTQLDWAEGSPTFLDLRTDVRRLLTTYNGSRPIRAWNLQDPEEDPTSHGVLLKPRLDQILDLEGTPNLEKQQSLISGLMWSLAPYAVRHSEVGGQQVNLFYDPDRPLQEHLARWNPPSPNFVYNYGGGDAWLAFTRAAMVSVNAMDWADEDSEPTIRRVRFEAADPLVNPLDPDGWEMGGSFEFGRIPDGVTPVQNPVAMIGLERQPFIREVSTLGIYFDAVDADPDFEINPDSGAEIYAEAIAFELGNPWDTELDLEDYEIAIARPGEIPSGNLRFRFDTLTAAEQILEPGEVVVFIASSTDPLSDPSGVGAWVDVIESRSSLSTVPVRIFPDRLALTAIESDMDSVTLWYVGGADYAGVNNVPRVLVDRLEGANQDFSRFPNLPVGIIDYSGLNPPEKGYLVGFTGSMRRYASRPAAGNGFPAYVLQAPELVASSGREGSSGGVLLADITTPPTSFVDGDLPLIDFLNNRDNNDEKGYSTNALIFPAFELFVSDFEEPEEIQTPADLLLVTSVSHVMFDDPNVFGNFDDPSKYTTVSEFLGDEDAGTRYTRSSDALGFRFGTDMPDFRIRAGAGESNPFIGKLDFTRDIPRDQDQAIARRVTKDTAIPLAARVLDAFDTVPAVSGSGLVQGRINVNTAPRRVLEALPYLFPAYQAGEMPRGKSNPSTLPTWLRENNDLKIAQHLIAYRDRFDTWDDGFLYSGSETDYTSRGDETLLTTIPGDINSDGLRKDAVELTGFVSRGELPLLGRWQWEANRQAYRPVSATVEDPLQAMTALGFDGSDLTFERLDVNPDTFADHDPVDDPSEWLALTRAITPSVDVRSDVFVAYLNMIAVSEDDLREAITEADRLGYGNPLEVLKPTFDKRYVVVFDRSNVERPSDRPRLLFGVREVPQW